LTALSKSGQAPDGQVLETQEIQYLPYLSFKIFTSFIKSLASACLSFGSSEG